MDKQAKSAFLMTTERDTGYRSDYWHARLTAVIMDGDTPRNPEHDSAHDDLIVVCQSDPTSECSYGWKVRYQDTYSVDLRRAEVMVATLRMVDRKMRALADKYGYPTSFAQYALRAADALGISTFLVQSGGSSSLNSANEYRPLDTSAAAYWLDAREAEYRALHASVVS